MDGKLITFDIEQNFFKMVTNAKLYKLIIKVINNVPLPIL